MKHLTDDERLAIIEGRATDAAREHVTQCAACAQEIDAWQRSIAKLENFDWPGQRQGAGRTRRFPFPLAKLAAAAALTISIGVALGRISAPNSAEIKAQVAAELRQELKRELAQKSESPDARAIMAALAQLRDQQSANYLQLRTDLETLAANADLRLQNTRRELMQLQLTANNLQ